MVNLALALWCYVTLPLKPKTVNSAVSVLRAGVKRPGREADHSPPIIVEVKKT
jgi:hypothetical protein